MTLLRVGAVSRNYFNLPLWLGIEAGFFGSEGLSLEVHLIEAIDQVTEGMASGALDLALNVTENTLLNRESGGDLTIIGGNVNRLPFSLIARPGVRAVSDLRGAKIGVSSLRAGSSSLVMRLLADAGLQYPSDYTLVAVGPILSRWERLRSGEIDAGLQGAPLNHIAIDLGFADLGSPRNLFPDFQFTSLDARRSWLQANPDTAVRFMRAFIRAHRLFYSDPDAVAAVACRETGVERRYADQAWHEYTRDTIFPPDGRPSVAAVRSLIEVSSLIRDLPTRASMRAETYVDFSFADAAERSLVQAG
jgi:ABC-type nitrate/sulfonate/bicarbonate transport system substrate-binding protein